MKVTVRMIESVMKSKKMSLRRFAIETNISRTFLSEMFNGKKKVGLSTEIKFLTYIDQNDKAWFVANITPSSEMDLNEGEVELLKLLRVFPKIKEKVLDNLKYRAKVKLKDKQFN